MTKPNLPMPPGISFVREIAEGGNGFVIEGFDEKRQCKVALKFLKEADKEQLARFEREAKVLAQLDHPNVVQFIDFLFVEEHAILVFELMEGEDLAVFLNRKGPISNKELRKMGSQLLEALAAAHELGVVHRDLKPANILLSKDGSLKLSDFGIAACCDFAGKLTKTGVVLGTPHYMSPEQIKGGKVDLRTDIYAAGVVLYEMATGRKPFAKGAAMEVLQQHLKKAPPPPRSINKKLDFEIEKVILRCLKKDADKRYSSAQELLDALDCSMVTTHAAEKTQQVKKAQIPASKTEMPKAQPSRSRFVPWLIFVILAITIVGWRLFSTHENKYTALPTKTVVPQTTAEQEAPSFSPDFSTEVLVPAGVHQAKSWSLPQGAVVSGIDEKNRAVIEFSSSPALVVTSGTTVLRNLQLRFSATKTISNKDKLVVLSGGKLQLQNCLIKSHGTAVLARGRKSLLTLSQCTLESAGFWGISIVDSAVAKISELTVKGTGAKRAINIANAADVSINSATFSGSSEGVYILSSQKVQLKNCSFKACAEKALVAYEMRGAKLQDIKVTGPGDKGVIIYGGSPTLTRVDVHNVDTGVEVRNEGNASFHECTTENCRTGFKFTDSSILMTKCKATSNGYFGLHSTGTKLHLTSCLFNKNGKAGVISSPGTSGELVDCKSNDNKAQGFSIGCNLVMRNCQASKNGAAGIRLTRKSVAPLISCTATNNDSTGVEVTGQSKSTIRNCTVIDNKRYGIEIRDTAQAEIEQSFVSKCVTGIRVIDNANTTLRDVTIKNCSKCGLKIKKTQQFTADELQITSCAKGAVLILEAKCRFNNSRFLNSDVSLVDNRRGKASFVDCLFSGAKREHGVVSWGKNTISVLKSCKIRNVGSVGLLSVEGAKVKFIGGHISGCQGAGMSMHTDRQKTMETTISAKNARIHNNREHGLRITAGCSAVLRSMQIENNEGYGILVEQGGSLDYDKTTKFAGNGKGDISKE